MQFKNIAIAAAIASTLAFAGCQKQEEKAEDAAAAAQDAAVGSCAQDAAGLQLCVIAGDNEAKGLVHV